MIRFCDKMVYCVSEGDMTRGEMFTFFLGGEEGDKRISDVIIINDKESNEFIGIVTYHTLVFGVGGDKSIYVNTAKVCTSDRFWEEANAYFVKYPKELLTVVNENGDVLGFAYYENNSKYRIIESYIEYAEKNVLPIGLIEENRRIKMLVITDLNEAAWKMKKIFESAGLQVCVIGEKWEWFGYKSGEGYLEYADFEKAYLYAEGTSIRRESNKKYDDIYRDFAPLMIEFFIMHTPSICREEIDKIISKGALCCEINIPDKDKIEKRTAEEMECVLYGFEYDTLLFFGGEEFLLSKKSKELIRRVYGKNVFEDFKNRKFDIFGLQKADEFKIGKYTGRKVRKQDKNKVYIIGPCIVDGVGCYLKDTFINRIQEEIDGTGYTVIAVPIDIFRFNEWKYIFRRIPICENDIILIVNDNRFLPKKMGNCKRLDMSYIYNDAERETLFWDDPIHSNSAGNRILAKEIYKNYLKEAIECAKTKKRKFIQRGELLSDEEIEQVFAYVEEIKHDTSGTVGAVVMNCNPFTYGHQYLVEYAASQVDWLYLFVLEENRSFFSFEDRLEMVKKGTAHLSNVLAVSSGRFIISYETMPIYFEKAKKQDMEVDARTDLEIFARYIAPALNIKKRFVGEEPVDKITNQYNEQMKDIFELFELEQVIIPRKELEEEVISASRVRKYMEEENWDEVKALVPETTFETCLKYKRNNSDSE